MHSLMTADFSSSLLVTLGSSLLAYVALLAIYRLYFSPLATFPGPKIAGTIDNYFPAVEYLRLLQ